MPVCGTVVAPSADTNTPRVPIGGTRLELAIKRAIADIEASGRMVLMPADFGIPERRCFTPTELAPFLYICPKTVQRMIDDEILLALPMRERGEPKIPYSAVVYYFLRQQGAMN